ANRVPTLSAKARSNAGAIGPQARVSEPSTSSTSSRSRSPMCGLASGIVRVVTMESDGCPDRILEQVREALVAAGHDGEEGVLDGLGDGAAAARLVAVDRGHGRHLGGRTAEEH